MCCREQGKHYLLVATDRTSKLPFAKLEMEANRYTASDFLRAMVAFVTYKIQISRTDNGVQFCYASRDRSGPKPSTAGTCSIASATSTKASIA